MTKLHYVCDLIPDFADKSLTIHGAWSHRHNGKHGWTDIRAAGRNVYARALRHVMLRSNDETVWAFMANKFLAEGDQ